jgi:hypothetical protein
MRGNKRLYLKVFIGLGHHSIFWRWQHHHWSGRRRSQDIQVLDLGIDGLPVARALLYKSVPLAPCRVRDSLEQFAGRYRCDPVLRDQNFQIE